MFISLSCVATELPVVKPRRVPKRHKVRLNRLAEWLDRSAWPNTASPGSFLFPEVVVNDKLVVKYSEEMGLGLWTRAGASLAAGEALLSVPVQAAIFLDDLESRHQPELSSLVTFVREESPMLMDVAAFSLLLLVESRSCGPGDGRWNQYLDSMDPDADHLPLMWSDEELTWLEGSGTRRTVLLMRSELHDMYQLMQMNDALSDYCPTLVKGANRATFREVKWVAAHILANQFGFDPDGAMRVRAPASSISGNEMSSDVGDEGGSLNDLTVVIPKDADPNAKITRNVTVAKPLVRGLVPWAHLFNHHHNAASPYKLDASRRRVDFWTARSYGPHEQVFINYGRLSSAMSIVSYGFLEDDPSLTYSKSPDSVENAYDENSDSPFGLRIVETVYERLELSLNLFGPRNKTISRLQQNMIAWRLGRSFQFSLRGIDGSPTPGTRFMLRMLALTEKDPDASSFKIGAAARIDGKQRPISAKNECGVAAILLDVCDAALSAFTTTLMEDIARISSIKSQLAAADQKVRSRKYSRKRDSASSLNRELIALKLRVRQKDILADCVAWVHSQKDRYSCDINNK